MKVFTMNLVLMLLVSLAGYARTGNEGDKSNGAPATVAISGIVTDLKSNEKLAGVTLLITSENKQTYSDTRGEFSLQGLKPGKYTIRISYLSYKEKEVAVTVTGTPNEKLEIRLNPVEP